MNADEQEIREVLISLLNSIQRADAESYKKHVSADLTCFEPETRGHRVEGVEFHLFLTTSQPAPGRFHLELIDPVIRVYGESGYACYTLLVSRAGDDGVAISAVNETRVFAKEGGDWKLVHFHRSECP